jgi:UDP-N-acetylmuramoyl-L-alanyl-D-glutamate--2,6-diaminopimelate ligase
MARANDVVLLAGKGHEASMIYGTTRRPWDDRDAARRALRAAGYAPGG